MNVRELLKLLPRPSLERLMAEEREVRARRDNIRYEEATRNVAMIERELSRRARGEYLALTGEDA